MLVIQIKLLASPPVDAHVALREDQVHDSGQAFFGKGRHAILATFGRPDVDIIDLPLG